MMLVVPASKSARIIPGHDILPGLLRHLISNSGIDRAGSVVTAATIAPRYWISRRELRSCGTFPSASRKCHVGDTHIDLDSVKSNFSHAVLKHLNLLLSIGGIKKPRSDRRDNGQEQRT